MPAYPAWLNRWDANVCGQRSYVPIFGAVHPCFRPGFTWRGPLEDFCPLHMACIMNGNVSKSLFARRTLSACFSSLIFPLSCVFHSVFWPAPCWLQCEIKAQFVGILWASIIRKQHERHFRKRQDGSGSIFREGNTMKWTLRPQTVSQMNGLHRSSFN